MNYKIQNTYAASVAALILAKEDHKTALKALIAHHGGKRCDALIFDLVCVLHENFPDTDAEPGVYSQQPVVSFPKKGSGHTFYRDNIAPLLPKLRKPTRTAQPRPKVDPMIAVAKRLRDNYSAAQIKRLKAML